MPIRDAPNTNLKYYLIAFDADGRERTDDRDGLMSRRALDALASEPITDVFLISHGWQGDVPAAIYQYDNWIGAMVGCAADVEWARQVRPGFRPLLIGLHWPSKPWGDDELGGPGVAFGPAAAAPPRELIDEYAERLADTPAARKALETIVAAVMEDVEPATLPPEVREAYSMLNREAGLGAEGVGAAPGADREAFDPEAAYHAGRAESDELGPFGPGGFDLGGLLWPLRQLSYWKMKDRARQFGESGGFNLLADLQRTAQPERGVRFHLMGHSFGCIVVSATLGGPDGQGTLSRPVHSLALVQGALSLWSYCQDIPPAPGRAGYFRSLVADRRVSGPVITTQSQFDTALGRLYPLSAGVVGQVVFAIGEYPEYGALGTWGVRGPGPAVVDLEMLPADASYGFEPGRIYNLQSSGVINQGTGPSGAHNDIAKPEVAHAFWEAALTASPGN